jgi:hypothetical protein
MMMLKDLELNYIEKWLPEASVKYKDGSPAVNLGLIITVFFKTAIRRRSAAKWWSVSIVITGNLSRISGKRCR